MKVVKASAVKPNDDGFVCYLTRKEAMAILTLTGNCIGGGSARVVTNHIYHTLYERGVSEQANMLGNTIQVVGDL